MNKSQAQYLNICQDILSDTNTAITNGNPSQQITYTEFLGEVLVYNDVVRAFKTECERDDFEKLLYHRHSKALGKVLVEGNITAAKTENWITFYKDGVEIDDADTYAVLNVMDGYYAVEGDKNVYFIKAEEAEKLGFEYRTDEEIANDFVKNWLAPDTLIDADLTDEQMDTWL